MFLCEVRVLLAVVALGAAIGTVGHPGWANRRRLVQKRDRMAVLRRRRRRDAVFARESDQCRQRPRSSRGLALVGAELRSPAGEPDAGQSADRRWRDVHDGGHQPRCRGARCRHRPVAVALAPDRRVAAMVRHHRSAREKLWPRRHLLDGWRGRRADLCRHEQLHARRARREDRATGGELRQERRRRSGGEPALERAAGIAS